MNNELETNWRKIKEGWQEWFKEVDRITYRSYSTFRGLSGGKWRPVHDLHGVVTATIKEPYRTWGIVFWLWVIWRITTVFI